MSSKKNFFKNLLTVGSYNQIALLIGFFTSFIVQRLVSPEAYGTIALITVFSGFIAIFSNAGFSFAVIKNDYSSAFLNQLSSLCTLTGFILCMILCALAYPISLFYNNAVLIPIVFVVASNFIVQAISIIPKAKLQKQHQYGYIGKILLIGQLFNTGFSIVLAYLGFSYWAIIIPQIISFAVQSYFLINKTSILPGFYSMSTIRETFKEIKSLFGNISGFNILNYWARNADNLLIGKLYSEAQLGIYNRAYFLLTLPLNTLSNVIGQVLLPTFKELKDKENTIEPQLTYLLGMLSILVFPISVVLITVPDLLISIIWGKDWLDVAIYLPFLGIVLFVQAMLSPAGQIFILHNEEKTLFKMGIVNSFILVASIAFGAIYSIRHIVLFYTISNILLTTPIIIIVGFKNTFHFGNSNLIKFWIPKLFLLFSICLSVWYNITYLKVLFLGLLSIHLLLSEWQRLGSFKEMVINIISKKK
ncbi:oligosaccharide flippase family protein [Flexithrix dorotheae]|uniref:oligosaccharide flippase family protein n=1 Tax=Flexithrix dorotheae TaxID=70993 RepID=UPI0003706310|nr:oligosaccharide flippase family protein [Flexithrix dorotheae]